MEKIRWQMVGSSVLLIVEKSSDRLYLSISIRSEITADGFVADTWRNRGELAEGWYDPQTLTKAQSAANDPIIPPGPSIPAKPSQEVVIEDDDDDDGYGPALPSKSDQRIERARTLKRSGPSIPNIQDLELRRGTESYISAMNMTLTSSA